MIHNNTTARFLFPSDFHGMSKDSENVQCPHNSNIVSHTHDLKMCCVFATLKMSSISTIPKNIQLLNDKSKNIECHVSVCGTMMLHLFSSNSHKKFKLCPFHPFHKQQLMNLTEVGSSIALHFFGCFLVDMMTQWMHAMSI